MDAEFASHLPDRCFLSHSFRAHRALASLRSMVPPRVELVLFNAQERDPHSAVSNGIVQAILGCEGLIYLSGGVSSRSFWVRFERDYGRRSKRAVFGYDVSTRTLRPQSDSLIDLGLEMFFHQGDAVRVESLTDWLERERYFSIHEYFNRAHRGGVTGNQLVMLEETLRDGGVVVWFVSPQTEGMIRSFNSEEFLDHCREDNEFESQRLENTYPDLVEDLSTLRAIAAVDDDPYEHVFQIFVRIDPSVPADWAPWYPTIRYESPLIDLIGAAPPGQLDWSSADDLMVRIYAGKFALRSVPAVKRKEAGFGSSKRSFRGGRRRS
jgi:hypothetical protein